MPDPAVPANRADWLNVPNLVTLSRLALSLVLFVVLSFGWYEAALLLFVVAAGTDWVDGFWARRYGQVTQLGRILDPFADKLIICGTFIYLAAAPRLLDGTPASGIAAWMVVVIVGRELGVTALRSFVEQQGGDFSAKWAGKWKMVFQCAAACFSLGQLSYFDPELRLFSSPPPPWLGYGLFATVWIAVVLTLYSGLEYIFLAISMLRRSQ